MNTYCHAILRTTEGHFLMQSRGYNPGIHNPGGVSLFGGGLEGNETPFECLQRELREEIELEINEETTTLIWKSEGFSPDKITPATRYHYLVQDVEMSTLILHEGDSILSLSFEEIQMHPQVPEGLKRRFREFRDVITL